MGRVAERVDVGRKPVVRVLRGDVLGIMTNVSLRGTDIRWFDLPAASSMRLD